MRWVDCPDHDSIVDESVPCPFCERTRAEQAEAELAGIRKSVADLVWKGATDNTEWQKRAGMAWKMWSASQAELERLRAGIQDILIRGQRESYGSMVRLPVEQLSRLLEKPDA